MQNIETKPYSGEIDEAKRTPNGWVYRIAGKFSNTARIPPDAIIGAWQVDETGSIVGDFQPNPNFNPSKWPRA